MDSTVYFVEKDLVLFSSSQLRYTECERKAAKHTDMVDIFKETRLFASRTSLAMHRSLNFERLDPMNAMNTHDALVINPMKMNISLSSSPFRVYFPRTKTKQQTTSDIEMWKRIKANGAKGGGGVTTNRLSPDEYGDILRDDLKCEEVLIAGHLKMVDIVKAYGNVGMDIDLFKVQFQG